MNVKSIAIIIPCYNEEKSISGTVKQFQAALPQAQVYICDNASTDSTAQRAREAGAKVFREENPGKGNAVRKLFLEVDADVYLMTDGDLTYDPKVAQQMVDLLIEQGLDMVVGKRVESGQGVIYRPGHRFGNYVFTKFLHYLFRNRFTDVFSGYRVFSRRFVRSFPAMSKGFEIETELSVHCLSLQMGYAEVPSEYFARIEGSQSKLNKYRDGFRIAWKMLRLFTEYKPLSFFGVLFLIFSIVGLDFFTSIYLEYLNTGLVPRFPTLIVSGFLLIASLINLVFGIVLHYLAKARLEVKRLALLSVRSQNR